jgi:hypothetical protein
MRLLAATLIALIAGPAFAACPVQIYPRVTLPPCQVGSMCSQVASGIRPSGSNALPTSRPTTILVKATPDRPPGFSPVSLRLTSQGMTFGLNPNGGGYGVFLAPPDEGNISRAGFGDGAQSSIRTDLHGGFYNPTQAGSDWALGTPTSVTGAGTNRLTITRYNVALFGGEPGDTPYDWWQFDSIRTGAGRDFRRQASVVNGTDVDGCVEASLDEEVRSEFDFTGFVERINGLGIPAYRIFNWWEYTRQPRAIAQFRPKVQEAMRTRVSLYRQAGNNPRMEDEDAGLLNHSWGIRLIPGTKYRYLWTKREGVWQPEYLVAPTDGSRDRVRYGIYSAPESVVRSAMVSGVIPSSLGAEVPIEGRLAVLMDGTDPQTAKGIAIYYPESPTNLRQTVAHSGGSVLYEEDRRLRVSILAVADSFANDPLTYVNQ